MWGWTCWNPAAYQLEIIEAWEATAGKTLERFAEIITDAARNWECKERPKVSEETRQLEQARRQATDTEERRRSTHQISSSRRRDARQRYYDKMQRILEHPNSGPWKLEMQDPVISGIHRSDLGWNKINVETFADWFQTELFGGLQEKDTLQRIVEYAKNRNNGREYISNHWHIEEA